MNASDPATSPRLRRRDLIASTAALGLTACAGTRARDEDQMSCCAAGLGKAAAGHFKHADFIGRAKAILDRTQDPELVTAFAFKIENGIDHMLYHPRTGDLAVLGDVADHDDRHAVAFGE